MSEIVQFADELPVVSSVVSVMQTSGSTQRDMRGLLLKMEIEGQRSIGFSVPASESMSFL